MLCCSCQWNSGSRSPGALPSTPSLVSSSQPSTLMINYLIIGVHRDNRCMACTKKWQATSRKQGHVHTQGAKVLAEWEKRRSMGGRGGACDAGAARGSRNESSCLPPPTCLDLLPSLVPPGTSSQATAARVRPAPCHWPTFGQPPPGHAGISRAHSLAAQVRGAKDTFKADSAKMCRDLWWLHASHRGACAREVAIIGLNTQSSGR